MSVADNIEALLREAGRLDDAEMAGDTARGLTLIARANETLAAIATALVERGVREGLTQRRMAQLLDVPESTLRGARREFGRGGS
jgi:hypothetical protein